MKLAFTFTAFICLCSFAQAQDVIMESKGISFADYSVQIEAKVTDLDRLEAPVASTDCEVEKGHIEYSFEDSKFSGGKHGTIEREWIAKDGCGNVERTMQFIVIKD